jgi:S-adenosylmethionine synthetase
MKTFFSSESVTVGHPDKMADQISDAVLDAILTQDPNARVGCETVVNTGLVLITGEITTNCYVDMQKVARQKIIEIGYDKPEYGFDGNSCAVILAVDGQSLDIAQGVDTGGAGDQGMMFGFACDETPEFMPAAIFVAHQMTKKLTDIRREKLLKYLRPDGKGQITFEYEEGIPKRIDTIVLSSQHSAEVSHDQLCADLKKYVILPVAEKWIDQNTIFHINPTGKFVIGGPVGDAGLTGRKIIVDTYGGAARHGGGCFSGKDATKPDRSATYFARFLAKNIVANGWAKRCEIQLSYAIGIAEPVSIAIETFGTETVSLEQIEKTIREKFDCSINGIIKTLDLRRPIFARTAENGHFGNPEFPWEKIISL